MTDSNLKRDAIALFESLQRDFPHLEMRLSPDDPNVDVSLEIPQ